MRDLAIQGAERARENEAGADQAIEYLIEWSTEMSEEDHDLLREARRMSLGGEGEEW